MKTIATTLGVSRSHLHDRLKGPSEPRLKPPRAQDAAVVQRIQRLVGERPTYGYRRITALLNRELINENKAKVNHKRVYRLMKEHNLLLARHTAEWPHAEDVRQNISHPVLRVKQPMRFGLLSRL